MINIGVIGYGYWGPKIVRNLMKIDDFVIIKIVDLDDQNLLKAKKLYPRLLLSNDINDIINDKNINAVIIATPVSTHFHMAKAALNAGKHTLVEKPLASTSEECKILIDLADKNKLILQVDHIFPYTGAINKIKSLFEEKSLGEPLYYDSVRINLGIFQNDVNVIWDLAVHDLSILDYLFDVEPISLIANGVAHIKKQKENIAYLTLNYQNNFMVNIHVNWLSPVKIRKILIGCDKKMVVYNDLEPTEKIKVYNKGLTENNSSTNLYDMRVGYRLGDIWAPQLDLTEGLYKMLEHFKYCINFDKTPMTSALSGLKVVKIMEAATRSMNNDGKIEILK
jgi:predicted dehydrogenase